MKKLFLISMLALLGMPQAVAQEYEYVPFVREGVKWVYRCVGNHSNSPQTSRFTLEIKGDTIIDGKTYKAVHKYHGAAIDFENDTVPVFLREEGKLVYGIVPEGRSYSDCPICQYPDGSSLKEKVESGEEFLLYNFEDPHYYESIYDQDDIYCDFSYLYSDTVELNGRKAIRHNYHYIGPEIMSIIEGIGYFGGQPGYTLAYLFFNIDDDQIFFIDDVLENGKSIIPSDCWDTWPHDEINDMVDYFSYGTKWVNERVIVNHGDTTCQYYSYVVGSGSPNPRYIKCHSLLYKEYDDISGNGDSIISYVHDHCKYFPRFINNKAFASVVSQDRNMIDFTINNAGGQFLYFQADYGIADVSRYYMARQREPFLNQENFVEIEPLYIDGNECSRWAYLGEDGEPLAYVVEGIGFDSRDLGDLLTPFTRKPDPDADYQEWCGLCHVVKDGKVIYKGMRYTPDNMTGIDEVVADKGQRAYDGTYYNLMGQPVGKEVPTTPGIYIHNGNKIIVR